MDQEPKEKSEKQKMLDCELYDAGDEELVEERKRCKQLCALLNAIPAFEEEKRKPLVRELLDITDNAHIEPNFFCDYGYNIHVGSNFYCNHNCVFLDVCSITIGKNCMMAPSVQLYTAEHPLDAKTRISGLEKGRPIVIGDNCWIGGGAIILPGVTIGDDCVIGAGSVVTKDIPSGMIACGNPCKVMKEVPKSS
eukprot:TRINITY_DN780362_c0_g1_i1.p1 TRINITY_DN780362_c0_g1~~TRINITY_DN780362_c0_g1_i1.p1  ORF type:complete len:194 (-),score=49.99 TRINITY_DN780362_c0_g1_i1:93-674(-)